MTMLGTRPATARILPHDPWGQDGTGLEAHVRAHGPLAWPGEWGLRWQEWFFGEIEASGLTGRGGAGFPSARKMGAVRSAGSRPVLLVNAMEGEPASAKDRTLVQMSPHLVLDGAELVGFALQAAKVVICLPDDREYLASRLGRALTERHGRPGSPAGNFGSSRVPVEIALLAGRYVSGEESALVAALAGGSGVPGPRPDKSVPLSLGRHPALVHNAETLAHVALIARHGAGWFRELGPASAPGTCLVTVSGDVDRAGVAEAEIGTAIADLVERARPSGPVQAVMVGGYGGSWLPAADLGTPYAPAELKALNASMGAGVLVALGTGGCGLRETHRVARFMAAESAGQCGPCLFGLPAVAADLGLIAGGTGGPEVLERLRARCGMVSGRGACRHPDGVVRLVQSALGAFAADLRSHVQGRPCPGSARPTILQFPGPGPGKEPVRL